MALTVDGIPVSGSIGKTTFSRNRYGAYTRRRTKPVNPNSTRQNAQRAVFRDAIDAWGTAVAAGSYNLWATYAAMTPWLNKAGETVHLTPQAAFVRTYIAYMTAGLGPLSPSTPPVENNLGSLNVGLDSGGLESDAFNLTGTITSVVLSNTWAATAGRLLVEVTPGQNQSRKYPGSRWALGAIITGANTATHALDIDLTLLPFGITVGQIVWLRVRGLGPMASDRRVSTQQILGPYVVQPSA